MTNIAEGINSSDNNPNKRVRKFILYVPGVNLTELHKRTPWIMLPISFQEIGYTSHLLCGRYSISSKFGFFVHELSKTKKRRNIMISIIEPFFAFRLVFKERPNLVIISPFGSYLLPICFLISIHRLIARLRRKEKTKYILKLDWSLDYTGLGTVKTAFSLFFLFISTHIFDIVSTETYCGLDKAMNAPLVKQSVLSRVPIAYPQHFMELTPYENSPRENTILCVARISRMKGQDILIKAFSLVSQKYKGWVVKFVGPIEDAEFKIDLDKTIEDLSLKDRIFFTNFVDENRLKSEFNQASIFCLPSIHTESAGNVKYEAMAYGLPVITSDVPCRRDFEDLGCLVSKAGNVEELSKNLGILMFNAKKRIDVSRASQQKLNSYLEVAKMYDAFSLNSISEDNY